MLIDTHTHINDQKISDTHAVAKNLVKDGIEAIIENGCDYETSVKAFELAQEYANIFCAVGIHPHEAANRANLHYDYFESVAKNSKVVAIGEIGLDYYRDYSPRDVQRQVFLEQLELAHALSLPVIIHCREAYEDTYKILKDNRNKITDGLVMHCYSGSAEFARLMIKEGYYLAFGGAITYHNNVKAAEVLAAVPTEYILLETDCPYNTPEPHRGKVNEPKLISLVAAKVAERKNISVEEVALATTKNAKTLFKKLIL